MGFFSKIFEKKTCAICGGEIGLLGNRKLEDGNCCKKCAKKLSPWFDDRRHSTVEQIKAQLEYRAENQELLKSFRPTMKLGENDKVFIDENMGRFAIVRTNDIKEENPDLLKFSQIVGCDIDIDESSREETRRNSDGEEESYDPPRYIYSYNFYIELQVDHPYFDDMRFNINNSYVNIRQTEQRGFFGVTTSSPTNSAEYRKYEDMARNIRDTLMALREKQMNGDAAAPVESAAPAAPAAAENKFCTYCGAKVTGKFCGECGAPV